MDKEIGNTSGGKARNIGAGELKLNVQEIIEKTQGKLRELARVDAALDRLENGTFGLCLSCSLEIDLVDLHTDPATSYCRHCADSVRDTQ